MHVKYFFKIWEKSEVRSLGSIGEYFREFRLKLISRKKGRRGKQEDDVYEKEQNEIFKKS
jgi:hypothetical protein